MVDGLSSGNTRTYISSAAIAVIDKVVAKRTRNNVSRFEISRKPVVRLNGKILNIGCVCYTTAITLSTAKLVTYESGWEHENFKRVCLTRSQRAFWSPTVAHSMSVSVSSRVKVGVQLPEDKDLSLELNEKTIPLYISDYATNQNNDVTGSKKPSIHEFANSTNAFAAHSVSGAPSITSHIFLLSCTFLPLSQRAPREHGGPCRLKVCIRIRKYRLGKWTWGL